MSDYEKYRGKCQSWSESLAEENPGFRVVRGHYHCPLWGEQAHWWCVDDQGVIHDPTVKQFPSGGMGEYVEFDGMCQCAQCGKDVLESDAYLDGNYAFCPDTICFARFVGVEEFVK